MVMSPNPSGYLFVKEESKLQAKCSVWSTKARARQCRGRRSQRFTGDPLHHSVSQMDSLEGVTVLVLVSEHERKCSLTQQGYPKQDRVSVCYAFCPCSNSVKTVATKCP